VVGERGRMWLEITPLEVGDVEVPS
jgi:hypothetical protein